MIVIDLNTRSAYRDNVPFIRNGRPVNGYTLPEKAIALADLEMLYDKYKHSVPDGQKYKYNYFKALSAKELNLNDLANGQNRRKAKERLELALLTGILNGTLVWPDRNKWFWQSANDKDFVLLKKWFEQKAGV